MFKKAAKKKKKKKKKKLKFKNQEITQKSAHKAVLGMFWFPWLF